MIVYRPSEGNDTTSVGISFDGNWFGESIGGNVIQRLKTDKIPQKIYDSDLSTVSQWFYKEITDSDFVKGNTFYRALYIGANDKTPTESEIIGDIESSYSISIDPSRTSSIPDITGSFDVDILYEGKFSYLNGQNSWVLFDENDTTGVLPSIGWSKILNVSQTLKSGEYVKIWIRITVSKDISMLDIDNFDYVVSINDLEIKIPRREGRLNISKVYSKDFNKITGEQEEILKQILPFNFELPLVQKIINHRGLTHVFYYDENNNLKDLIIQKSENINENKYIDLDITYASQSTLPGSLTYYGTYSDCVSGDLFILGFGEFPYGTFGYNGVLTILEEGESWEPTYYWGEDAWDDHRWGGVELISGNGIEVNIEDLIDKKFVNDVIVTNKPDRNDFYIFYNEFKSNSDDDYITTYGHRQYFWNSGILYLDLDFINDNEFLAIEPGIENKLDIETQDDVKEFIIRNNYYTNSVTLNNDLFISTGYIVEDCRNNNNITLVDYIWEKDIINDEFSIQSSYLPFDESGFIKTIHNKSNTESYLNFSDLGYIDFKDFTDDRFTYTLTDEKEVVHMASPHQKSLKFAYSTLEYDVIDENYNDFSTTFSFNVDINSVSFAKEENCSLLTTWDNKTPYHLHLKYQSDLDSYLNESETEIGIFDTSSYSFYNKFIELVAVSCRGSSSIWALKVEYNFDNQLWGIRTKDSRGEEVFETFDGGKYSWLENNVITINSTKNQIWGCGKKYIVNFVVYINGEEAFKGISYTENTTDEYVTVINPKKDVTGEIHYWEVRKNLINVQKYSQSMYKILSNVVWCKFDPEKQNNVDNYGFEFFAFKRDFEIVNLDITPEDDMVIPVVLQGNAYNLDSTINENVRRSIFDFNKINTFNSNFAFAIEGHNEKLEWVSSEYDANKDILVIWVRLKSWQGQKITMYYGNIIRILDDNINNPYSEDYFGVWHMDSSLSVPSIRAVNQKIFNAGEPLISYENQWGQFLYQMDHIYMYGIKDLYKSHKIDIEYDDSGVDIEREEGVNKFLVKTVKEFLPGFTEIRNINGTIVWKIESDQVG